MLNLFKLEKLKIECFKNKLRAGLPHYTIEVMFNPESYSQSYSNTFQKKQGINTTGSTSSYSVSKPEELKFDLILDSSGVTEYKLFGPPVKSVYEQVQDFLKKTYYMQGATHQPAFLRIKWGPMVFDGRLQDVKITYEMFDKSGVPVRGKLDVTFTGDVKDPSGADIKNSPDLTHHRVVKGGETLPMLSNEIYGSPSYYLQLAAVNNLDHFRELQPGQELIFPPLNED
ncbi:MAG: hypothetical protein H6581_04710 [Bacteroidia bacterium]|nr:hypothetical protein [Bacteroidia bacterium]